MTADAGPPTALNREELLRRAAALVPLLQERAARTEELRRIPPETITAIVDAGLLRIGNPRRFGGLGFEPDMMYDVAMELGRGCGSTGWCYAVWTIHNWAIGHFPLQAQEEYFAETADAITSSAYNPLGARALPVTDGYRVTGRWDFSSGCDTASWATLGALGPQGPLWVMIPQAEFTILDTWYVMGLRGTGSKDIVVEDVFVPAHRTLNAGPGGLADGMTVGWEVHHRPSYRIPLLAIFPYTLAAPVIGMAQGAVDAFARRLQDRDGESVSSQLRLAEASAEVDAARILLRHSCRDLLDRAARGDGFTALDRARYRRDHAFVARLCLQAVNRLFEASGGHALYESQAIQRFYRDAHAAANHVALAWDASAEQYSRAALGLPLANPRR